MKNNNFNIKDKNIKKSLNYLSKFNDFVLIIIKDQKSLNKRFLKKQKTIIFLDIMV